MSERDEGYLQALTDLKGWHENILAEAREPGERAAHQKTIGCLDEMIQTKKSAKPKRKGTKA